MARSSRGSLPPERTLLKIAKDRRRSGKIELNHTGVVLGFKVHKVSPVGGEYGIHGDSANDVVIRSRISCVLSEGKRRIGALEFASYAIGACQDNIEFLRTMDLDESDEGLIAQAVHQAWPKFIEEHRHDGDLIDFRGAWIDPQFADTDLLVVAAQHAIGRVIEHYSVVLSCTSPDDPEGGRLDSSDAKTKPKCLRLLRRKDARRIGLEVLAADSIELVWTWRPHPRLAKRIDPPRNFFNGKQW